MSGTQVFPSVQLVAGSIPSLYAILDFWVANQAAWLAQHPEVPHPYDAGIRYENESPGREVWQSIRTTLRRGWGDCEDLALYLAAWYVARKGITARVRLIRFSKAGKVWYHAVVVLPDGRVEDPSRRLGM